MMLNGVRSANCVVVRKDGEKITAKMDVVVTGDNIILDNFTNEKGEPLTLYTGDSVDIEHTRILTVK